MTDRSGRNFNFGLAFVVRSVGERTESLCIDLLEQYRCEEDSLSIIRQQTHADAVEGTLRIAADQPQQWTVAVDADMLLYPTAVDTIRRELMSAHSASSVVHFAVSDKLYRMKRWGVTVFRRDAAAEAVPILRSLREQRNLKIERALIKKLESQGRKVEFSRTDVALHDFLQYYADLYRKAYLNAVRNPAITRRAHRPWKRISAVDRDYAAILKGSEDALIETRQLSNSVGDFEPSILQARIRSLGLDEKNDLTVDAYVDWDIEKMVEEQRLSLRKHKVARDYFEVSLLEKLVRRARRKLEPVKVSVARRNYSQRQ